MAATKVGPIEEQETRQCERHGAYEAARLRMGAQVIPWSGCPACLRERDEAAEAEKRARWAAERLAAANIPRRHAHATLDNWEAPEEKQQRALAIVREYLDGFGDHLKAGRCMLFYGSTGTGKTHLACALARALSERGRFAYYSTLADLIGSIRDTWRRDSARTEGEVLAHLRQQDLLILDEVGVQFGTDAERVQVTNVIDMRYRDMKPTLVITNCGREQLRDYLGDRVLSRMRENGGKGVVFDWTDWRGSKQ